MGSQKLHGFGWLCRKSDSIIFGLVKAERCQLEFCRLFEGAGCWSEYLGLGEAESCGLQELCAGARCDFGRALCRKTSLDLRPGDYGLSSSVKCSLSGFG